MLKINGKLIEKILRPGLRLPWIKQWLMECVWSQERYDALEPMQYLNEGEACVNKIEELIASTADRIYFEFLESNPAETNIGAALSQEENAIVVFDGMSVREMPILISLAKKSGMAVKRLDYSFSAVPSETIEFIQQKIKCPKIGPSQLPGRKELTDRNIQAVYLSSNTQSLNIDTNGRSLLVWSSFPDNTYADSGARFDKHFENICYQIETAWMHSIQKIKGKKKIIITSDHGYAFLDSGLSFVRKNFEMRDLNGFFGNNRSREVVGHSLSFDSDDIFMANGFAMIKGRVHTRSTGQAANRLYKHGGMSLMECFTPWLELKIE